MPPGARRQIEVLDMHLPNQRAKLTNPLLRNAISEDVTAVEIDADVGAADRMDEFAHLLWREQETVPDVLDRKLYALLLRIGRDFAQTAQGGLIGLMVGLGLDYD